MKTENHNSRISPEDCFKERKTCVDMVPVCLSAYTLCSSASCDPKCKVEMFRFSLSLCGKFPVLRGAAYVRCHATAKPKRGIFLFLHDEKKTTEKKETKKKRKKERNN